MNRSTAVERLRVAKRPEDVFGVLAGGTVADRLSALKHSFNGFLLHVHPDHNPGLLDAGVCVTRLMAFRKEAAHLLETGTYGTVRKAKVDAVLKSRTGTYKVHEEYRTGEVADLFLGEDGKGQKCLLKIVRQPSDNDLLDFEARTLTELHRLTGTKARVFQKYLPKLYDSFSLVEGGRHRRVNVLDIAEPEAGYVRKLKEKKGVDAPRDYYSLAEIRDAYPDGIDARDVAWMIRRAFEGVGWVHEQGFVHGAMLPEHVLVHPLEHGARIVGWSYAVKKGQKLTAISAARKKMYPPSVLRREPATAAIDVQMIGECAVFLCSGKNGNVPKEVALFFDKCRAGEILDGWSAYHAYNEVLDKSYGKRAYRAFAMPPTA